MQLEAAWTFPSRWSNGDCVHPLRLTGRGGTRAGPPVHCGSSIEAAALRPGGPRRDAARPDTALRPEKQQLWPIIRPKKYFGERRARPRCPAGPQDAQNAAQGAGMGGATAPGGPPWGPAGRCQITFSTVFLATLGYFFSAGEPRAGSTVRWDSGKSPQIRDGGPHGQSGQRGAGGPRGEMDVRGGARPALRRPAGPSSPASDHPPTLPPDAAPRPNNPLHHPCTYPDLRKWLDVKQFGYHKTIVRAPPSWGRLLLTRVGPVGQQPAAGPAGPRVALPVCCRRLPESPGPRAVLQ